MRLPAFAALLAALWLAAIPPATAGEPVPATATAPVVVELFTSHGCGYCPPADAFLGELAQQDDVLALSMHVTYFNGGGWRDPFSLGEVTTRQKVYQQGLGLRGVYTPQMIVDGMGDVVGSDRPLVQAFIETARQRAKLPLGFVRDGDRLSVVLPQAALEAPATVWVVLYDRRHSTVVKRHGTTQERVNYNVVRALRPLGRWDGRAMQVGIVLGAGALDHDGLAVIIQRGQQGPVLGAAAVDLKAALGS